MSLDQKEREREMVSRLLSDLYPEELTTDDVVRTKAHIFNMYIYIIFMFVCVWMCVLGGCAMVAWLLSDLTSSPPTTWCVQKRKAHIFNMYI